MDFFFSKKLGKTTGFVFGIFTLFLHVISYAYSEDFPKLTKGLLDKKEYQYIQLENRLTALLISDKEAVSSKVAMGVNVGSAQDPDNRLGLAHMLEHMILIGSQKYPEPDNFNNFTIKNGGYINAYTDNNDTIYYYSINSNSLEESLDRFANIFISPSLEASYIEKERHAVNSEHNKNLFDDNRIARSILDATANPNNTRNRFGTGNLITLHNENNSLQPELRKFFDRYYVADNMNLVIYSDYSINELKKLVIDNFSGIKSGIKTEQNKELYINSEQQGMQINIKTINDIDYIAMEFYIPLDKKYQFFPVLEYIDRFLLSCFYRPLQDKGLLLNLHTTYSPIENNHIKYTFKMPLTKEGTKNIEYISAVFFDAINYIKKTGIVNYMINELKIQNQQSFDYDIKVPTIDTIHNYAWRMNHLSYNHVLDAYDYIDDLTEDVLNNVIDNLTWDKMRLIVANNEVEADTNLDFYNSKYKLVPFSDEFINRLKNPQEHDYFSPPEKNIFIIQDLEIKNKPEYKTAKKIIDNQGIKSWYMPDNQFNLPISNINLYISNNLVSQNAENFILNMIYTTFIHKTLKENRLASLSGIESSIISADNGIVIKISGFHDKQTILLESYLKKLKELDIDKNKFDLFKQNIIDNIENKEFSQPYYIAQNKLLEVVKPYSFANDKLIAAAKKTTLEDLQNFISKFFLEINIKILLYGNYTESEAYNITSIVKDNILTYENAIDQPKLFRRSINDNVVFSTEINNKNSCCINYYRIVDDNLAHALALSKLTKYLLKGNFFTQLRTEEQLGYVVFNGDFLIARQPWISFTVQSDVKNPEYISKRINSFLSEQIVELEKMTDKEFNNYRNNLVESIEKLRLDYKNTVESVWSDIDYYDDSLETEYHTCQEIKKIEKQDIINLIKHLTTEANSISIQLWGNKDKTDKEISDQKQNAFTKIEQLENKFPLIEY